MKLHKLSFAALLVTVGNSAVANKLPEITVYGETTSPGQTWLNHKAMEYRLTKDSNISDLLSYQPAVRTAIDGQNSLTQGEITPQNISFHGDRYYNNNFMINGISSNDNINPIGYGSAGALDRGRTYTISPEGLPAGHPQAFWISPELLERVEIYDSNIPSEFGQFTGGVVNAELKEPDASRTSGAISYRHTRSAWTKFHLEGEYKDEFYRANSPLMQPKFVKHQYHFHLNQPVNHQSALIFAYDRQDAFIPQHQQYLKLETKQRRRAETLLLSYKNEWNENNTLLSNLIYSPHSGDYYLDNVKNGGFRESGGGWLANLKWKHHNHFGLLTSEIAYRNNKNQTQYDAAHLRDYYVTKSINWLSQLSDFGEEWNIASEGGIGTRFTQQKQLSLKQAVDFHPFSAMATSHEFSAGWEWKYSQAKLTQKEFASRVAYYHYLKGEPFSATDCTECIPGEQYAKSKIYWYPVHGKVNHGRLALYLQDKIKLHDLAITAGLRAEKGQFLKAWLFAPRLSLDYDLQGKDQTHLIGGYNRYYADDLLDYQLRSNFNFRGEFERPEDSYHGWDYKTTQLTPHKNAKLKTPYSDEVNIGISQKIANSLLELKWVQRDSKRQFMTAMENSEPYARWLTNGGKNKSHSVSLQLKNQEAIRLPWVALNWKTMVSYQKSRSNQTSDYTQRDWQMYHLSKILYKGKLQNIDQMPAQTFNDPWRASIQLESHFPKLNLAWTQQLNYTSGARTYERTGFSCNTTIKGCGNYEGRVVKVTEYKYPREITLDWAFVWKKHLAQHQAISINLSVFNVLNQVSKAQKVESDQTDSEGNAITFQTYKPGRQFWLGAKYEF